MNKRICNNFQAKQTLESGQRWLEEKRCTNWKNCNFDMSEDLLKKGGSTVYAIIKSNEIEKGLSDLRPFFMIRAQLLH